MRALETESGDGQGHARACEALASADTDGLNNVVMSLLRERCKLTPSLSVASPLGWKPRLRSEGIRQAKAAGRILAKWDYYKEVGVLEYVLSRATPGDPDSVSLAIE